MDLSVKSREITFAAVRNFQNEEGIVGLTPTIGYFGKCAGSLKAFRLDRKVGRYGHKTFSPPGDFCETRKQEPKNSPEVYISQQRRKYCYPCADKWPMGEKIYPEGNWTFHVASSITAKRSLKMRNEADHPAVF